MILNVKQCFSTGDKGHCEALFPNRYLSTSEDLSGGHNTGRRVQGMLLTFSVERTGRC